MPVLFAFLLMLFLVGTGFIAPIASSKTPRLRQILFAICMVLVNGGALIVLGLGFLVTRLEGSTPPSLGQYLAPLWIPLLLLLIIDGVIVFINQRMPRVQ